ncbi:MAG: hypothetical protein LQ349_006459 [Xanthoria aureola]|nr:MAG: hypothetical protein LQ349_006459 [Xanthoria aureola]
MSKSYSESYHYLVTHIVPGPNSISYFIPFLLLPTALCIPPSILSQNQIASLFLPLIFACLIHAWSCMNGLDVISVNLMQWSFVLLVCYDPRKTFIRLRQPQTPHPPNHEKDQHLEKEKPTYVEEPYPNTLPRRIPWVLTLLVSLRLSNWKTGHPSHDRQQPITPLSRTAFCTHALLLALQSYLILDTTSLLTQSDPYFHITDTSITHPLPPQLTLPLPPILQHLLLKLPPRLIRTTILALQPYALITQGGSLPTLPILLLNALHLWPDEWSPHTWPIFFGPLAAVPHHGLRGLWGTWWHQTNRYLSIPGRSFARWIGLERKSARAGYMCSVVSAFALSGVMHMGLVPPEPVGTEMSAMTMRLYVGAFFWLQILGIGIEVAVVEAFQRVCPSRWRWRGSMVGRIVTLGWVGLWGSYTLPLLAVPFRELGYWDYPPLPVSVTRWGLGRGWWAW